MIVHSSTPSFNKIKLGNLRHPISGGPGSVKNPTLYCKITHFPEKIKLFPLCWWRITIVAVFYQIYAAAVQLLSTSNMKSVGDSVLLIVPDALSLTSGTTRARLIHNIPKNRLSGWGQIWPRFLAWSNFLMCLFFTCRETGFQCDVIGRLRRAELQSQSL